MTQPEVGSYEEFLDRILRPDQQFPVDRGWQFVELIDRVSIAGFPAQISTVHRFEETLRKLQSEGALNRSDLENIMIAAQSAVTHFRASGHGLDARAAKGFAVAYFSLQIEAQILRQEVREKDGYFDLSRLQLPPDPESA